MPEYRQSRFRKREIFAEQLQDSQREAVTGLFAAQDLSEFQAYDTTQREMFGEQYDEVEITQDVLVDALQEEHTEVYQGKKLNAFQKGKRAEAAEEKLVTRQRLRKERELFFEKTQQDQNTFASAITDEEAAALKEKYHTDEGKEMLRYWGLYHERGDKREKVEHELAKSDTARFEQYKKFMSEMMRDKKDYSYGSDEEFMTRLAEKYHNICRFASLSYAFDEITAAHAFPDSLSMSETMAKIRFYERLKDHYDDKIKLMYSPYYTLLTKGDLKARRVKHSEDPDLKAYLELYEKVRKSEFGKGADLSAAYQVLLDDSRKAVASRDKGQFEAIAKETSLASMDMSVVFKGEKPLEAGSLLADAVLKEKKEKIASGYPTNDLAFLKEVEPVTGVMESIGSAEVAHMEEDFKEILEKKTYRGKPIPEDALGGITEAITGYCQKRREYLAAEQSVSPIVRLKFGTGFDMTNPEFMKSEEFKKIQDFANHVDVDEVKEKVEGLHGEFMDALTGVYEKLEDSGMRILTVEHEAVQTPQAAEAAISHWETRQEEVKTFKFNGKKMKIYGDDEFLAQYAGTSLHYEGDIAEEMREELEQIIALDKEIVKYEGLLKDRGDERAIAYRVYKKASLQERAMHEANVRRLMMQAEGPVETRKRSKAVTQRPEGLDAALREAEEKKAAQRKAQEEKKKERLAKKKAKQKAAEEAKKKKEEEEAEAAKKLQESEEAKKNEVVDEPKE